MDIFSQRFKELKNEHHVTYQQIADVLGVKLRTVQYYASGHLKPDYYGLIELSKFFDCSADYLMGLSNNPKRNE